MRQTTSMRGRPSSASGIDLDARAAAGSPPARRGRTPSSAKTCGDVVAVGAHRAGAPDAEADAAPGSAPVSRQVALEQLVGQLLPDLPGGLAGQRARVDGVEVAPGRQHVGHAARRRAARPGRDVAPVERRAAGCRSRRRCAAGSARARRRRSAAAQATRRELRVAMPRRGSVAQRSSARSSAASSRARRSRRCAAASRSRRARRQRVGDARVERRRRARRGRRQAVGVEPRARARRAARRGRGRRRAATAARRLGTSRFGERVSMARSSSTSCSPSGTLAEDVQAVADLRAGQLAQVAVDVLDQVGEVLGRASRSAWPACRRRSAARPTRGCGRRWSAR